jgi:hypothetical protein
VIALDSTGIKVANRGEWIRHKWNVRRGYLKIHVAVDIRKKKIVTMEVTSEEVHDGKVLKKLIDNASENKVKRASLGSKLCNRASLGSKLCNRASLGSKLCNRASLGSKLCNRASLGSKIFALNWDYFSRVCLPCVTPRDRILLQFLIDPSKFN